MEKICQNCDLVDHIESDIYYCTLHLREVDPNDDCINFCPYDHEILTKEEFKILKLKYKNEDL